MMRSQAMTMSANWIRLLIFGGVYSLSVPTACVADDPPAAPQRAVLQLTNGDFVPGQLISSDDPNVLCWQSPHFTKPLQFPIDRVGSVLYAAPTTPPVRLGEYSFELQHGDVLFGSLLGLSDDEAELDVPRFGRVHVRRDHICRLYRCRSEELIYAGPNGLSGWNQSSSPSWREDGGLPGTDKPDVFLYGDFKIPARAAIEFELSWKDKADFVFALDVDQRPATLQRAFRFEVWDSDIVVHRETESEADVVGVQEIKPGSGRVHLLTYLDRPRGRLLVFSPTGVKLADLLIAPREAQDRTGLWLVNKRGDIRLDRLRITHWNGVPPQEAQANGPRLHRTDGSLVRGQITAFDPAANLFTVRDSRGQTRVPADQITSVFLSPVTNVTGPPPNIRALYQDGTQLSGEMSRVEDGHLLLAVHGIREPLRLPMTELRGLTVLQHRNAATASSDPGRIGTLELEGTRLRGRLASGQEQPDASCLVWKPEHSEHSRPLRPGLAGRIVYRQATPPPKSPARSQVDQQRAAVRERAVRLLSNDQRVATTATKGNKSLHLRSGDVIPCEVQRIDEHGVTFKSPLSDATFIAHQQVKAIELATVQSALKLNNVKRERLLTLPRMQKGSPPTHLFCSSNGDILRGRLLEMDDKTLRVEVRLETRGLPRDRVSQIIWLHDDELAGSSSAVNDQRTETATRVQALRSDGVRLTFFAEQLTEQTLSGTSEVLGQCQADLSQVDQLVFGAAIQQAAMQLVYHQWKLHHAIEPKFVANTEGQDPADRVPGTDSALVGKPAPDFELALVGGDKFQLADNKDKIVVLDFWTTWCGPCLQAMPQLEKVVREFDGQVRLLAINLEETDQQIRDTLERHGLQVTAALDRNGAVAAKYAVTAIPHTVIIDRTGTIARLFVGGGPQLEHQLRDAIQSLLDAEN